MEEAPPHIPVLLDEVMQELDPHPGQRFIDATVRSNEAGGQWVRL